MPTRSTSVSFLTHTLLPMQFTAGTEDRTLFCKGKAAVDDHLISVISWFHDVLFSDGEGVERATDEQVASFR